MAEKEGDEPWYQDRGAEKTENSKVKMENGEEGERERRKDGSEYGGIENSRPMIIANWPICQLYLYIFI
jgi:hypothetical protein